MWRPRFKSRLDRLRRYRHITAVLMKYGLEEVADAIRARLAGRAASKSSYQVKRKAAGHSRPERVRMALEEMGPTFTKFGQLLSTRPDLIPAEYILELERLQDRVKPEDPKRICAEIERQLGGTLIEFFKEFECAPLAAGSIAQVHKAQLLDGTYVAIKVRRPRIVEVVEAECEILKELAGILQATVFQGHALDLGQMTRELTDAIRKETDLANERRNQLRFQQGFAQDPTVHIPKIYEDYCTDGLLTMEYIHGTKPASRDVLLGQGLDPKVVARRGADFVLRQVFDLGFFHADPHPGNFFLLPDNVLVPLDFGQVAALPSQDRRLVTEILLSMVAGDARRIVTALDREDMLHEDADVSRLTADIEQLLNAYQGFSLKDIPFGQVMREVFDVFRVHRVRPPAQFTLMLKSLVTIEAFAKGLDPDFNLVETLTPYAERWTFASLEPKRLWDQIRQSIGQAADFARRFPEDANAVLRKLRQGKVQVRVHHEHLENLAKTLDRSSNRISFALIIAALLVASSLLVPQQGKVLGLVQLQTLGVVGYVCAAVFGIWLLVSILRSGRV